MRYRRPLLVAVATALPLLLSVSTSIALAQPISGSSLSHRSTGTAIGLARRLDENGYVGTYFSLDQAGSIYIQVSALGATGDSTPPRMGIAIADRLVEFDVSPGANLYSTNFELPAGTYFVRTQFSNADARIGRSLTVNSLSIQNASSISNESLNNRAVNEANALAAADTYIEHFRQGGATLSLAGAAEGDAVEVRMLRNEFNFGTYVTGFNANSWVGQLAPGETASDRARYQDFVKQYFNMLVPSNMGKWQPTENSQGAPTMSNVDAIIGFTEANNMSFRQHNLAWGHQQPAWVNNLIDDALAGDSQARANLRQAVIDRITYYVGDGDTDQNDGDRARSYEELDVVNEILREMTYYNIFGADGIAEFYKLAQDVVEAAGADTLLYTNEYNVFNFASDPFIGASDDYANWYREHVETLNNAGYGRVVTGIGIQAQTNPAPDGSPTSGHNHNAARMNQVLQNMAITGLPVTLTEFSVPTEAFGVVTSPERAAEVYNETLRMMYGAPNARSMLIWEEWPPNATNDTTIVDANWNLTLAGQAFVELMEQWTTPAQSLTVDSDGIIQFNGYYGQYEVVIDGATYLIDHSKDTTVHSIVTSAFLPGDYNRDGVVDAADCTVWRDSLDQTVVGPYAGADGDGDGRVGSGDYLV
ncbi:MAG: endo-1,4-beta-xylanase, partial [Planctomycetales bacterium]|nr:endo-1,4-beta-xylanase [Planctomycetales bacterium]